MLEKKEGAKMTTRADVAKLAGVSESTVSYVLSGKRPISEATKKRVLAAIDKSGYKSNYAAAALAGGTPRLVTMMVSNLFKERTSQIIGTLVEGVVDGVDESGFHSVIWPVSENADSDIKLLLKTNISGGVILMNVSENDQRVHLLNSENVPFVVLGRTDVGFDYNYVDRDFDGRDRLALEKLKELGHNEIGVILYGKIIRPHLRKIAKELKLNLYLIPTQNTFEGGGEAARILRERHPQVTGVISLLDVATLGFVESAESKGILIPEEVSLIGLNMLESQAESISPAISTIAYDAYEMAKSCGKLMVEVISGDKSKPTVGQLWTGVYMERETVAQVRRNRDN